MIEARFETDPTWAQLLTAAALLALSVAPATSQPLAYVPNQNDANVMVLNMATLSLVDTIDITSGPPAPVPRHVAVSADGTRAYVSNQGTDDLAIIDTATNTIVDTVATGDFPQAVVVNLAHTRVYVANFLSHSVTVIDPSVPAAVDTIPTSPYTNARGMAVSPDGTRAYVSTTGASAGSPDHVHVIDTSTNTIIDTVEVGESPGYLAVSPDGSRLYVSNFTTGDVTVVNTTTNAEVTTVAVGNGPQGIAVSPDGSRVYVAVQNDDALVVIDTATNMVDDSITVGDAPNGVAVKDDGKRVYVTNVGTPDDISVVDPVLGMEIADIPAGNGPTSIGDFLGPDPVPLFADDFESADTSGWSTVVP